MSDAREGEEPLVEPELDDEPSSRATMARRGFLGATIAAAIGGAAAAFAEPRRPMGGVRLRPPGALPEEAFTDACVRCFRCANACPNDTIRFHGLGAGLKQAFTPYVHARERGCVLCGECAEACPTGALRPFEVSREGWIAAVDMGKARLNEDLCFSYHGRTCGACYRACPLAGQAMTIGLYEAPTVHPEHCVGCGLCEQACLHLPQAIRVIPTVRRAPGETSRREPAERPRPRERSGTPRWGERG
ncbi:MAG: 4Fe-4S dicluster domain-containing protein [Myxococcales bacterium]|nr:4Fe-4S dicluster domain-containing protein [Myxococcales bacterium]